MLQLLYVVQWSSSLETLQTIWGAKPAWTILWQLSFADTSTCPCCVTAAFPQLQLQSFSLEMSGCCISLRYPSWKWDFQKHTFRCFLKSFGHLIQQWIQVGFSRDICLLTFKSLWVPSLYISALPLRLELGNFPCNGKNKEQVRMCIHFTPCWPLLHLRWAVGLVNFSSC